MNYGSYIFKINIIIKFRLSICAILGANNRKAVCGMIVD